MSQKKFFRGRPGIEVTETVSDRVRDAQVQEAEEAEEFNREMAHYEDEDCDLFDDLFPLAM